MEAELEGMGQAVYGRSRAECFKNLTCISCGQDASQFVDAISKKEYGLSCLCQSCQDKAFAEE